MVVCDDFFGSQQFHDKIVTKFFFMVWTATFISQSNGFEVDRTFCVMARPWYLWICFICLYEVAMPSDWLFHVKNTCLKEIIVH